MPAQLRTLNRAMSKTSGPAPTWGEVMCELWPVIATPLTGDDERLLLELLRHEGRLRLVANDELPHSLPPEDMLKSLAVQALGKWTRLTYLTEMQRLELLASSPELATIVRSVIEDAKVARVVPGGEDAIADAEVELPAAEEEKRGWISLAQPQRPAVKPGNRQKMYAAKAVARRGGLNYIQGWQRRKARRKQRVRIRLETSNGPVMKAFECTGFWDLPGGSAPVAGMLRLSRDDEARLLLIGELGLSSGDLVNKSHNLIVGSVDKSHRGSEVTLSGCVLTGKSMGSYYGRREEYRVARCYFGAHIEKEDDFRFRACLVQLGGLSEWAAPLSGLHKERPSLPTSKHEGKSIPIATYLVPPHPQGQVPGGKITLNMGVSPKRLPPQRRWL